MSFRDVLDVMHALYMGTLITLVFGGFYAALVWWVGNTDRSQINGEQKKGTNVPKS